MLRFSSPYAPLTGLLLTCLLPVLAGCGRGGLETAPVSGQVSLNGEPVEEGTVIFLPEKGRAASGQIEDDGSFSLSTYDDGDGAVLGKHRVAIVARRIFVDGKLSSAEDAEGLPAEIEWLVPQRYANHTTSELSVDVGAGSNQIELYLTE